MSPRVILIFCGPPSKNKPLVTYLVHSIFVCELQNCKHVLSLVSRMTYNTLESKNKIFIHFMHHCELKPKFFVSLTFPSFQLMSLYNHAKIKTIYAIYKWMIPRNDFIIGNFLLFDKSILSKMLKSDGMENKQWPYD